MSWWNIPITPELGRQRQTSSSQPGLHGRNLSQKIYIKTSQLTNGSKPTNHETLFFSEQNPQGKVCRLWLPENNIEPVLPPAGHMPCSLVRPLTVLVPLSQQLVVTLCAQTKLRRPWQPPLHQPCQMSHGLPSKHIESWPVLIR